MCFSAGASFTAGSVLLLTGIVALKKAPAQKHIAMAAIPLIFSVQQFSEGILWMSFMHEDYEKWQLPAAYAFLVFAQIVWPMWVPLSFLLPEPDPVRKKLLVVSAVTGLLLSLWMLYCLCSYKAGYKEAQNHIQYELLFPRQLKPLSNTLYFFVTVITPFISCIKRAWIIGFLLLGSLILSKLYFHDYVISVWCFFAAFISIVILFILQNSNKEKIIVRDVVS